MQQIKQLEEPIYQSPYKWGCSAMAPFKAGVQEWVMQTCSRGTLSCWEGSEVRATLQSVFATPRAEPRLVPLPRRG